MSMCKEVITYLWFGSSVMLGQSAGATEKIATTVLVTVVTR